ncbi:hypothetical protein Acr_10g0010420 [Actinidia rufa]|uniref:Uncharacterized protein n=1 Tax=Actinidia rufa TaxID=165716 RepID=A0A7J0FCN3_9ERIC|nr:hypothetical protein Acr_10g0010420 [Actinidia rufa]
MANTSQALNLEGIHHEMHGIAEQIRIMNEINVRLVQHLAINNPPPPTASLPKDADPSRCSCRSGDQDSQSRHSTGRGHSARIHPHLARKPRDAKDHLAEMTELTSAAISLPPRKLRNWMLGSMPSTPAQMPLLLWMP